MSFVQIIDFKTDQPGEMNRLMDEWVERSQGKRTATHSIMGRDREESNHFVEIVEFPSYEEAMRNSSLPETNEMFERMSALCESPPSFTNLEVVREERLES